METIEFVTSVRRSNMRHHPSISLKTNFVMQVRHSLAMRRALNLSSCGPSAHERLFLWLFRTTTHTLTLLYGFLSIAECFRQWEWTQLTIYDAFYHIPWNVSSCILFLDGSPLPRGILMVVNMEGSKCGVMRYLHHHEPHFAMVSLIRGWAEKILWGSRRM